MPAEVSDFLPDKHEIAGSAFVHSALTRNNLRFDFWWWVIEVNGNEALAGRLFQVLEDRLITWIIRDNQHEVSGRFKNRTALFDGQTTTMIRKWMNDNDRVFARFDYFVEITDGAVSYCRRQWTVMPDRLFAFQQKTSNQIG